jgi:ubiquinone/menaquinone biosynthesis C-methylase UbiE
VGCAKGFLVQALKRLGVESWGVDISQYALESAPAAIRSSLLRIDADGPYFPFKNGIFDLVTCITTVEHLRSLDAFLQEMQRVLTKRGTLYLVTDDPQNPEAVPAIQKDVTHENVGTYTRWHGLFMRHNFAIKRAGLSPSNPRLDRVSTFMLSMVRPQISQPIRTALLFFYRIVGCSERVSISNQIAHRAPYLEFELTKVQ